MSFVAVAVIGGVAGLAKTGIGIAGASKAKKEQEAAEAKQSALMNQYKNLDRSNPYLNMENVYEDLTVNQKQAEFTKQQQEQQRANIMGQMSQAAGGSGIAALAQAMANQGSLDAQKSAISIGEQEKQNQLLQLGEDKRLQDLEIKGELYERGKEEELVTTQLGMAQADVAAAAQQRQQNRQMIASGIGDVMGAGAGYIANTKGS